jgi:hypothetical protein
MPFFNSKTSLSLIAVLAMLSACGGDNSPQEPAAATAEAVEEAVTEELPTEEEVAAVVEEASAFPSSELVDPNTATQEELAEVVGMTEAAAAAILAGRPFATPTEMDAAIGDSLDDAGRKVVYAQVFIKVGLNSGAEDDYKLIPSSLRPGHLAHEFEEYRPYESIEQFSREMSKYVSDEEVVYLTRFVTLD